MPTEENPESSVRDPNIAALRRVPIFAELESEALQLLARNSRRRTEAAETSLFHEGDDPGSLYIILQGSVHIRTVTAAGKNIHIARRGPGEHIGELSLLDGAPRMADAVTAEPSELLILRRDAFTRCVETHPKIALAVMCALAERLREAAQHLASQEEQDVSGRLARLLLEQIESQTASSGIPSGEIRLEVQRTHQQMADQVGAARESVSRALADLRLRKIIRTEGRALVVIDAGKLKRQAER